MACTRASSARVNLPEGIRLVVDESLRDSKKWACGANEVDYHYTGACPDR